MAKPSKACTLSHYARAMFCGALILYVTPLTAAGQNPQPEKAQTENVSAVLRAELRSQQQAPWATLATRCALCLNVIIRHCFLGTPEITSVRSEMYSRVCQ